MGKIILLAPLLLAACSEVSTVKIHGIESKYETYVEADYSESSTGLSADGTVYSETDYWTETVSEKFYVICIDGEVESYYCNGEPTGYTCLPPRKDQYFDHSKSYFDNYDKRQTLKSKCFASGPNGDITIDMNKEELDFALKHIGDSIQIEIGLGTYLVIE